MIPALALLPAVQITLVMPLSCSPVIFRDSSAEKVMLEVNFNWAVWMLIYILFKSFWFLIMSAIVSNYSLSHLSSWKIASCGSHVILNTHHLAWLCNSDVTPGPGLPSEKMKITSKYPKEQAIRQQHNQQLAQCWLWLGQIYYSLPVDLTNCPFRMFVFNQARYVCFS